MSNNQNIIEVAFEKRSKITPSNVTSEIKNAVNETIDGLNDGSLRVATRINDSQDWETHQWIKKAVLLSFRIIETVLSFDEPSIKICSIDTFFCLSTL